MNIRVICVFLLPLLGMSLRPTELLSAETATSSTSAISAPALLPAHLAVPLAAPLPRDIFDTVSAEQIKSHVEYLASPRLKGRRGAGAWLAANYITHHFEAYGLKPLFNDESYYQPIPGAISDSEGQQNIIGRNVGAWLPGSDPAVRDEFIIISAHYDHLGVMDGEIYPGADDNASGVSMMLEIARQLTSAQEAPRRSIVFVGFDLEEQLLWGSRWFANHPPWPLEQVKLFITADMIGRTLGDLPLPVVFVLGSESASGLKESLDRASVPREIEVARMGIDLIGTRSDYGPFRDRQVPFLFFSGGEHPDYHTPRDVPERVDFDRVARITALTGRVCCEVADSRDAPVWNDVYEIDLDEARALNRISTMLLDNDDSNRLGSVQRAIVTHAQAKTEQIVRRGSMTPLERKWLIRLSQVMLFSVF